MDQSDRLAYCGGTDASAVICSHLGVAYPRSAWEVWAERFAPEAVPPRPPTEQGWLDLGHALEGYVLARYAERIAPDGLHLGPAQRVTCRPYPWMRGSLDATVLDADGRMVGIVDAKTSRQRHHWWEQDAESGRRVEGHPYGYEVQVRWYAGLARLAGHPVAFGDLAALDLMGARVDVRTIEHDEGQWGGILAVVIPWWERHILGGHRPEDDYSECARRWHLYCQPRAKSGRRATPDEVLDVQTWRTLRDGASRLDRERGRAETAVLAHMNVERLYLGDPEAKGTPYVQVQASGKGRTLKGYRFPDAAREGEE